MNNQLKEGDFILLTTQEDRDENGVAKVCKNEKGEPYLKTAKQLLEEAGVSEKAQKNAL